MLAAPDNFTIQQGATFRRWYRIKDSAGTARNLSGSTARMKVKGKVTDDEALIELTTANSRIVLSNPSSSDPSSPNYYNLKLALTDADTGALDFKTAVFDIEIVTGSEVERPIEGTITLSPEVTD